MTEITLLDGSIGQEIVKRSGDRATHLWSTSVMMDKPDIVGDVHMDYFRAGATIATANTYAVHVDRLARVGLEGEHMRLLDVAIAQAERARRLHGRGRIAVSLGPLGASYRTDIDVALEDAARTFSQIVTHLDKRCDLFIIETAASIQQARGALMGCRSASVPVWLSVTADDSDGTKLRSSEPMSRLEEVVGEFEPEAVLVNCCRPEVICETLDVIAAFGPAFGAYANGFTRIAEEFLKDAPTVDALEQRKDLSPAGYAEFAMAWVEQGATIVGGCCEIGPAHIAEIARRLRLANHEVV